MTGRFRGGYSNLMSKPNTSLFPITVLQLKGAADRMINAYTTARDAQRPAFDKRLSEWKQPTRWQSLMNGASRTPPEWVEKDCEFLPHLAPEYHRQIELDSRIANLHGLIRLSESVALGEYCWLCRQDMDVLGL